MNQKEKQKIIDERVKNGKIQPLYIPELLEFVGKLTKKEEKISTLQNNDTKALREIFRLTFSPDVNFMLEHKEVKDLEFEDIDIADYSLAPSTLFREFKRLSIFTNEKGQNLRKTKLKILLSQMFSGMYKEDIDLVKAVFTRKLPYKGITANLVKDTFPGLIPEKPQAV